MFLWPAGIARRCRRRAARARRRLVDARPRRVHVLGVRARDDRARVRARHARGGLVHAARLAQPPSLRRLHRARGDRPARARHRRLERVRLVGRAEALAGAVAARSAATRSRTARSRRSAARTTSPFARRSTSRAEASSLRRVEPGKNRYFAEQQVSNEMAIHTDWLRAEDVDVIADQIDARRRDLLQGARQAAREPDLARRARLPRSARWSRSGPTRASSGALRRATRSPEA